MHQGQTRKPNWTFDYRRRMSPSCEYFIPSQTAVCECGKCALEMMTRQYPTTRLAAKPGSAPADPSPIPAESYLYCTTADFFSNLAGNQNPAACQPTSLRFFLLSHQSWLFASRLLQLLILRTTTQSRVDRLQVFATSAILLSPQSTLCSVSIVV